jgi:hypothetical protein
VYIACQELITIGDKQMNDTKSKKRRGKKMENLMRVVIKEEFVKLTGDYKKAVILNQLIYWSQRIKDFDKFLEEEKERSQDLDIELRNGWIYKKSEELSKEVFGMFSGRTISRILIELEAAGYLHSRNNPKFKWDRVKQYRVNLKFIRSELLNIGYVLEGFSLKGALNHKRQIDESTSQSVSSNSQPVSAIPEITTEITTETNVSSSSSINNDNGIANFVESGGLSYTLIKDHLIDCYLSSQQAEDIRRRVIEIVEDPKRALEILVAMYDDINQESAINPTAIYINNLKDDENIKQYNYKIIKRENKIIADNKKQELKKQEEEEQAKELREEQEHREKIELIINTEDKAFNLYKELLEKTNNNPLFKSFAENSIRDKKVSPFIYYKIADEFENGLRNLGYLQ